MCLQHMDSGSSSCYYPYDAGEKWYYDIADSKCKKFTYGGCGGNTNRFDSKFECVSSCKPRRKFFLHNTVLTVMSFLCRLKLNTEMKQTILYVENC